MTTRRGNGKVAPITRESDAWFLLAEKYEPCLGEYGDVYFLCDWLYCGNYEPVTEFHHAVPIETRRAMARRISEDLAYGGDAYSDMDCEDTKGAARRHANARRLACLMFGHEAKSEGR